MENSIDRIERATSGMWRFLALLGIATATLTGTAWGQQFSLVVTYTVSPIEANGWSGTRVLTVTNTNWVYTAQLTNANNGCLVQRTESGQGQISIPLSPNPSVPFSFVVSETVSWFNTFCPAQANADNGSNNQPTGPVTILATPVAGGFTLSTNTVYPPDAYYGGAQMTVTASGFLGVVSLCDSGTTIPNVTLPPVPVIPKISIKPWQITYAALNLNFAVTQSAESCDAQSNTGSLGVFFKFNGSSNTQIANSITSAQLSVFQPGFTASIGSCQFTVLSALLLQSTGLDFPLNDCLLNGSFDQSASYVRWSSPGFKTVPFPTYQSLIPGPGTGPLTFWVDLDALGLSATNNSMDTIVRTVEPYIHQTLIDNLPFFAWYTVIQDPGNVGVLVVNRDGLTSGNLFNGKTTLDIPQSLLYSSTSNPAVILQNPPDGGYQVVLTGLHTGGYELSVSATSFNHQSSQQVMNGTIAQGASTAYQLDLSTSNVGQTQTVNLGTLVPGDLNGDERVNCADLAVVKASFGKKTGQAGFNAWADINDDGVVNILDLSMVAKQLPAGTVCK
jgi:hypothetical protein